MALCTEILATGAITTIATFLNYRDEPCPPTVVTAKLEWPDGTVAPLVVFATADAHVFSIPSPPLSAPGTYWLHVEGAGAGCDSAQETSWSVVEPRVTA